MTPGTVASKKTVAPAPKKTPFNREQRDAKAQAAAIGGEEKIARKSIAHMAVTTFPSTQTHKKGLEQARKATAECENRKTVAAALASSTKKGKPTLPGNSMVHKAKMQRPHEGTNFSHEQRDAHIEVHSAAIEAEEKFARKFIVHQAMSTFPTIKEHKRGLWQARKATLRRTRLKVTRGISTPSIRVQENSVFLETIEAEEQYRRQKKSMIREWLEIVHHYNTMPSWHTHSQITSITEPSGGSSPTGDLCPRTPPADLGSSSISVDTTIY